MASAPPLDAEPPETSVPMLLLPPVGLQPLVLTVDVPPEASLPPAALDLPPVALLPPGPVVPPFAFDAPPADLEPPNAFALPAAAVPPSAAAELPPVFASVVPVLLALATPPVPPVPPVAVLPPAGRVVNGELPPSANLPPPACGPPFPALLQPMMNASVVVAVHVAAVHTSFRVIPAAIGSQRTRSRRFLL